MPAQHVIKGATKGRRTPSWAGAACTHFSCKPHFSAARSDNCAVVVSVDTLTCTTRIRPHTQPPKHTVRIIPSCGSRSPSVSAKSLCCLPPASQQEKAIRNNGACLGEYRSTQPLRQEHTSIPQGDKRRSPSCESSTDPQRERGRVTQRSRKATHAMEPTLNKNHRCTLLAQLRGKLR